MHRNWIGYLAASGLVLSAWCTCGQSKAQDPNVPNWGTERFTPGGRSGRVPRGTPAGAADQPAYEVANPARSQPSMPNLLGGKAGASPAALPSGPMVALQSGPD